AFTRYADRTGTKAWEKAPSANRRRRKLGILKATKKESAAALSPNRAANTTSRTRPRMRERKVAAEVTADERNSRLPLSAPGLPVSGSEGACLGGWELCMGLPADFGAHVS